MPPEHPFYPESLVEREVHLEQAQAILNHKKEALITPPSSTEEDFLTLPLEDIQKKHKRRYDIFLRLIQAQGQAEDTGSTDLSVEEVEQMRKWLQGLNTLDTYIQAHKDKEQEVLRERQVSIFEDLRNFIEAGQSAGYVKLPTGVGKTVLFTELTEALNLKTLIVVPTRILVGQTEEKIEQFAPDLDVGKIHAHAKDFGRQATIITYDSLLTQLNAGTIDPAEFDCLMLDEAHLALSAKRAEAVNKFDRALKLGFTATPDYSEKKRLNTLLPVEIHSMKIREAVEEGLLCGFSSLIARTHVDISKVKITERGEYDQDELEKAVNIASRNQAAVDLYKQAFKGQLAVAYCAGVKHADAVATLFNHNGIKAEVISGKTPPTEQERIKRDYKAGKIKVLCNADILIAGFDEPKASVCFNLRPTLSRVVAEQRGGRVVRLDEDNDDKHAYIVDFIDQGLEKRYPVLFADVAEGAEFTPKKKKKKGGAGVGRRPLPILHIPNLELVMDVEEVMRIVKESGEKNARSKIEAPSGWKPTSQVAAEIGISENTLIDFAVELKQNDATTYAQHVFTRPKGGKDHYFFNPEAIPFFKEHFKDLVGGRDRAGQLKRRGYKSVGDLKKELGAAEITIQKLANEFLQDNPDAVEQVQMPNGKIANLYAPATVEYVREHLAQTIPSDFKNIPLVSDMLGIRRASNEHIVRKCEAVVERLKADGVPDKELYIDQRRRGKTSRWYAPRVFEEVIEKREEKKSAIPENYQTANAVSKATGVDHKIAGKLLEEIAKKFPPEDRIVQEGHGGAVKQTIHYSPRIIARFKKIYQ